MPGTRFDNIHDKVTGNDIPAGQDFLGDQWGEITGENKINPVYIICSLGGNDVSDFDTSLKEKLNTTTNSLAQCSNRF